MKKALILNISHNDIGQIKALKNMGYYVVATGNNPQLVGKQFVDKHIIADYSNKNLIKEIAEREHVDAICSCCNDFGVITAAYVAEQLGLPGHDTYQNAITLHHKNLFKEFAEKNNVRSPKAKSFNNQETAKDYIRTINFFPLMVKPIDLTGGKGCSKVNGISDADEAIERAFAVSKSKNIVVEQFIEGSQHACCTFLINQKVRAVCTNNEYSFTNPYKVEIDTYPASDFESIRQYMISEIERIAGILHLNDGIFHVQYLLKNGVPYIIEAMRRILGNLYMLPAQKLTGLDWDYWEARVHCGLGTDDFPNEIQYEGYWAYRTLMGKKNGVIKDVHIADEAQQYMFEKLEMWRYGDVIENYKNDQLGFYFFQFENREQMNEMMLKHYSDIYVEYE